MLPYPELILSLKVEELQKPVTEWILVDTPQEYLKDIIYSNDNKGYIVLGKKSVQVSMRYIDEIIPTGFSTAILSQSASISCIKKTAALARSSHLATTFSAGVHFNENCLVATFER